jgi:hypothetical protein
MGGVGVGVGVGGGEPDTGLDAGRNAVVGSDQSQGGPRRSRRPHDDPTAATRCWNVEPLLHAEDGYVELEGSVLVADR